MQYTHTIKIILAMHRKKITNIYNLKKKLIYIFIEKKKQLYNL